MFIADGMGEAQAAAAAASIQNTSLGDPHDHSQRGHSDDGDAGGATSAPPGMGAGAGAAGQLGPGREVVNGWRVSDVAQWLRSTCGLAAHVPRFVEQGRSAIALLAFSANLESRPIT